MGTLEVHPLRLVHKYYDNSQIRNNNNNVYLPTATEFVQLYYMQYHKVVNTNQL